MSESLLVHHLNFPPQVERRQRPAAIGIIDTSEDEPKNYIASSRNATHQQLYEMLVNRTPELQTSRTATNLRGEQAFVVAYTDEVSVTPIVRATNDNPRAAEHLSTVSNSHIERLARAAFLIMKHMGGFSDEEPRLIEFSSEELAAAQIAELRLKESS